MYVGAAEVVGTGMEVVTTWTLVVGAGMEVVTTWTLVVVTAALVLVAMLDVLLELEATLEVLVLLALLLADEVGFDEEELETEPLTLAVEEALVVTVLIVVLEEENEEVVPRWIELDGEAVVVGPLLSLVVVG